MESRIYKLIDIASFMKENKKGHKRQLQLVNAAIDIIHTDGLENLSYELLSKKCKIARSLIYHYFPKQMDLLFLTSTLIRYNFQNYVISKMQNQNRIKDILSAYIMSSLEWADVMPKEACVWVIFFQKCTTIRELAEHNRNLVDLGTNRISQMLLEGIKNDEFHFPPETSSLVARRIQIIITGGLISRATEFRSKEQWDSEFRQLLELCLDMLDRPSIC